MLARPELKDDPRFLGPVERANHHEMIDELLSGWTRSRTKRQAMTELGGAGVPAGAVFDTLELSEDPDLRRRGMFVTVDHPGRGKITMPGWPVKMSGSHVPVMAAPLLGQHKPGVVRRRARPGRAGAGPAGERRSDLNDRQRDPGTRSS